MGDAKNCPSCKWEFSEGSPSTSGAATSVWVLVTKTHTWLAGMGQPWIILRWRYTFPAVTGNARCAYTTTCSRTEDHEASIKGGAMTSYHGVTFKNGGLTHPKFASQDHIIAKMKFTVGCCYSKPWWKWIGNYQKLALSPLDRGNVFWQ